ncbi:MAG: DUF4159 domain-containing protein [Sedimentisphaerales bacterium]|nr:DUF4159 domain-containing protein [Sedimentisphaerales bacterium]
MKRREFLRLLGRTVLAGAVTSKLAATEIEPEPTYPQPDDYDRYDFVLPRIKFTELPFRGRGKGPDLWNNRPGGDANLLRELSNVVRCRVKPITGAFNWTPNYAGAGQLNAVLTFDEPDRLREYPFLFMTGENGFEFTDTQKQNLQDYITAGGFLLMDDCVVGTGGDFFYRCSYTLLEDVFGRGAVQTIPPTHEIFHNIYDFGQTGLPSLRYCGTKYGPGGATPHGQNHGARGVFVGDRLAVFLSSTDLHCGWCDSQGIEWGVEGYRKTIEMGINIILYALTH